jgi:FkbM family methyltransferase
MRLPKGDTHFEKWVQLGYYQRSTLFMAMARVTEWDTAVDIGGHVGFMSRDMAKFFSKVHAFEPQGDNFRCLRKNTPENVRCYNVALGEGLGKGKMESPKATNSGAWELKPGDEVTIAALDAFNFLNVGLIKIDVQGYEMNVLKGAVKTLDRNSPVLIVECPKAEMAAFRSGGDPPTPVAWLAEHGYRAIEAISNDVIFIKGE